MLAEEVDVAHLLAEHRALIEENERLRDEAELLALAYNQRTTEVLQVRRERDDLLAEKGIEHHGSDAT